MTKLHRGTCPQVWHDARKIPKPTKHAFLRNSNLEEPITNFTALEMPPKGFPIVQFDMHIAEDIGFDKFDILSQRGLGHIEESVRLIEKTKA